MVCIVNLNSLLIQLTVVVLACLLFLASAIPMPFNAQALPGAWHYNGDVARSCFCCLWLLFLISAFPSVALFFLPGNWTSILPVAFFVPVFGFCFLSHFFFPGNQTLPSPSTSGPALSRRSSPSAESRELKNLKEKKHWLLMTLIVLFWNSLRGTQYCFEGFEVQFEPSSKHTYLHGCCLRLSSCKSLRQVSNRIYSHILGLKKERQKTRQKTVKLRFDKPTFHREWVCLSGTKFTHLHWHTCILHEQTPKLLAGQYFNAHSPVWAHIVNPAMALGAIQFQRDGAVRCVSDPWLAAFAVLPPGVPQCNLTPKLKSLNFKMTPNYSSHVLCFLKN